MEKRIGIDTYIFIELFSGEENRTKRAEPVLKQIIEGYATGIISSAALTELYYHLNRYHGKEKTEYWIIYLQNLPNTEIISLDTDTAILAGRLRTKYYKKKFKEISYLDCMHIATAIKSSCTSFITGDKDFSGIEEIKVEII